MPTSNSHQGFVHSIETAGAVDGPGIRYILFLSGCPLQCQYCHNPDSRKMKEGTLKTVDEVMSDIKPYISTLKRMKGGVTISGGEPLTQTEFCGAILEQCKALGLHTAIDTSGFHGMDVDGIFLQNTDLVLLDIKSSLPSLYKKITRVDLQPTLDFLHRLSELDKPVWVRFVLIPELTDSEENLRGVAKICASFPNIQRVDLLPFHKMGEYKWKERNLPYALEHISPPDAAAMERARTIFREQGVVAV
ncbi:MAG: pyruvate formate lyase-activating protein [Alphaproteobacteria bacterium]|nr:pyruvate formate lyase-activating protein [Alphaproteobacteria bacterium]MCB9985972.1 pyruvate formate lyase-activating protein [Micavibrio sp.]HPQ51441.1 pyruvate formate-lyase-activating protein [Alphaproteobacteria bacterium]HRK96873.1 pyruvate formate-lyase-activating protein [Alphaproteobacteria bacterium]